jgi:hypothetical protein
VGQMNASKQDGDAGAQIFSGRLAKKLAGI